MAEWVRFWVTAVMIVIGLVFFIGAVVGNCRFAYVMNRVHAAGLGDTMGLFFVLAGLMVSSSGLMEGLKLLLPLVFLWMCSPVSSHFLSDIEYYTNEKLYEHMERL